MAENKGKVTGIGGIFFKCDDPDSTRQWYADHLGLKVNPYGSLFESRDTHDPEKRTFLQWSTFSQNSTYMEPSTKDFMINYRVKNMEALLAQLKVAGVQIIGEVQEFEYGKFAHIMDPEGNKLELWEPIDKPFADEHGLEDTTN